MLMLLMHCLGDDWKLWAIIHVGFADGQIMYCCKMILWHDVGAGHGKLHAKAMCNKVLMV